LIPNRHGRRQRISLTRDAQTEDVSRFVDSERDLEAFGREERLEDVAHDVDLFLLAALVLLPDDRVLEHVELARLEVALHLDRLARIDDVHVTL